MFPVTSKRFASSVNIPKRLIFGQHEIARQTPVNVARLPDMESIESRTNPTLSIVSSPSPLPLESDVGVGRNFGNPNQSARPLMVMKNREDGIGAYRMCMGDNRVVSE